MSMYKECELQENENGEIAVLVSHGYGAGWSTWNDERLAYDKRVVELFDKNKPPINKKQEDEIKKKLKEMGYRTVYMGGYEQIEKVWIPKNVQFRIHEYDGSEHIQWLNEVGLIFFT